MTAATYQASPIHGAGLFPGTSPHAESPTTWPVSWPQAWSAGDEPYLLQALRAWYGRAVVVQTVRDTVRGIVADLRPDYVTVRSDNAMFFIRLRQIVWISPS